MKLVFNCFAFLFLVCLVFSCAEQEVLSSKNSLQTAKTESIKRGEPVMFTFSADSSGKKIEWRVTPALKTQIIASYNKAKITFSEAGTFTVSATNGNVTERTAVTVDSTIYVPGDSTNSDSTIIPPVDTIRTDTSSHVPVDTVRTDTISHPSNPDSLEKFTPLSNDELVLTPVLIDSLPLSGLMIKAITTNSYKCYRSYMIASSEVSSGSLKILYSGIYEYLNCTPEPDRIRKDIFLPQIKTGTSVLEIEVSGKKYTGTVISDGSSFTIQWPYTSGVRFTALKVSK